jgi:hypothetical protein
VAAKVVAADARSLEQDQTVLFDTARNFERARTKATERNLGL